MEKVQQVHKRRETENDRWITTYYVKELQKANQKEFRVEKVIKRKREKLYIKWKGYDNSFTSWTDKKRHSINE